MLLRGVALAFLILRSVNATLRAHRVRSLHRYDGKQLHRHARFRHANRGHQAGETPAHYNDLWLFHFEVTYQANGCQLYRKLTKIKIPTVLNVSPTSTPSCPATRCARVVAANPHLHRKFQIPTPRWNEDARIPTTN